MCIDDSISPWIFSGTGILQAIESPGMRLYKHSIRLRYHDSLALRFRRQSTPWKGGHINWTTLTRQRRRQSKPLENERNRLASGPACMHLAWYAPSMKVTGLTLSNWSYKCSNTAHITQYRVSLENVFTKLICNLLKEEKENKQRMHTKRVKFACWRVSCALQARSAKYLRGPVPPFGLDEKPVYAAVNISAKFCSRT